MKLELKGHRSFKIPRAKLDLFLTSLDVNFSDSLIEHRMSYVFLAEDSKYYDVVVAQYGSYPFKEEQLDKFVETLGSEK